MAEEDTRELAATVAHLLTAATASRSVKDHVSDFYLLAVHLLLHSHN